MKFFRRFLLFPAVLGLVVPTGVDAGGGDHSSHHGHHSGHGPSGDHSQSTMIMGKSTFVVGGVDGVTRDETVFNYETRIMGMTSFTGQDMLKTAIRVGNFGMQDPFGMGMMGMGGEARLGTAFSSNNNLELHKAFYQFPVGENISISRYVRFAVGESDISNEKI